MIDETAERIARLEARADAQDRVLAAIADRLEDFQTAELERLGKVYDAIDGLRRDLWLAKGAGHATAVLGAVLAVAVGAAWSVFQYLHPGPR